jgi:hypothetical protein
MGVGLLIFTDQMTRMNGYFKFLNDIELRVEGTFQRMMGAE